MEHRCLATVNINGFLTERARKSFMSACERWGCDFSEIHAILKPECPSCSKYLVPRLLSGYENIMVLDADTVISDSAPNPFELAVSPDTLYAVSDYQVVNQCYAWIQGPFSAGMSPALTKNPNFKSPPAEQFFNGGMWLCHPVDSMIKLFQRAAECLPEKCDPWIEQGTLNVVAYNSPDIRVCLLPEKWNHIIPKDCNPIPEYYINHFGGWAHDLLRTM